MNTQQRDYIWNSFLTANEAFHEGRYSKAGRLFKEVLQESAEFGELDPRLDGSACSLAETYCRQGAFSDAAALYRAVSAVRRKILGPKHPQVLEAERKLADALWQVGCLTPGVLARQN
ncbi:MAG: tetratricopeptide repeat protein [Candidatus Obscuribacterales bacterium]